MKTIIVLRHSWDESSCSAEPCPQENNWYFSTFDKAFKAMCIIGEGQYYGEWSILLREVDSTNKVPEVLYELDTKIDYALWADENFDGFCPYEEDEEPIDFNYETPEEVWQYYIDYSIQSECYTLGSEIEEYDRNYNQLNRFPAAEVNKCLTKIAQEAIAKLEEYDDWRYKHNEILRYYNDVFKSIGFPNAWEWYKYKHGHYYDCSSAFQDERDQEELDALNKDLDNYLNDV